jgi:hypothetical protein
MSGVTEDELDRLMRKVHHVTSCGSWAENMRAAVNELLERRDGEQKPMHEPATDEDAAAAYNAMRNFHALDTEGWKNVVNVILARRAAATRAEVVVTEETVNECHVSARHEYADGYDKGIVSFSLNWLADRLNGKRTAPVDPRAPIIRRWVLEDAHEDSELDRKIVELLVKLDEAKP